MKLVYRTHDQAFRDYTNAKYHFEKRAIACAYFDNDAPIVNAELKKKLEEEKNK